MATSMAPVGIHAALPTASQPLLEAATSSAIQREVVRCEHCNLNQYRTPLDACRRCKKSLLPEPLKAAPVLALVSELHAAAHKSEGISVSTAVRDLRHVRNLSQRQLAARMNVPRTYISKIENGKAMPTLSSLDRLARALQVDISALLRDAPNRHHDETALLSADPFLGELARYAAHLTVTQKSIFLNQVRELAQSASQGRIRRSA